MTARWISGLDGLRAIAVIAVVIFHLGGGTLPGGFLGVDLFFVISGFLITSLLVGEWQRTGRVALGSFYVRRAKRLLPAVGLLLAVVAVAGSVVWTDQRPTLGGSLLSSAGYVTNWWMIADQQSYFVATGRPPMLQHLWSLAIEEQFYLLWAPAAVVLLGAAWVRRTRIGQRLSRPAVVAWVALGLAIASTAAMAVIAARTGVPEMADSGRVYFGTDTHAMGLLLGSAAGALFATGRLRLRRGAAEVAALAGLAGVLWFFVTVDEYRSWLYRGGFLLFAAVALIALLGAATPGSWAGRALDIAPLRWIGRRSYGIYLWHWPVAVVTRPMIDVGGPLWLVDTLRIALPVALAAISFRYLEEPVRRGYFRQMWGAALRGPALRSAPRTVWTRRAALPGVAIVCIGALGVIHMTTPASVGTQLAGSATESAEQPWSWGEDFADAPDADDDDLDSYIEGGTDDSAQDGGPEDSAEHGGSDDDAQAEDPEEDAQAEDPEEDAQADGSEDSPIAAPHQDVVIRTSQSPAPQAEPDAGENAKTSGKTSEQTATKKSSSKTTSSKTTKSSAKTTKPAAKTTPPAPKKAAAKKVSKPTLSAFGDSVLMGAAPALKAQVARLSLNAVVGRQSWDTLNAVTAALRKGSVAKDVVIHTGTNGLIPAAQLRSTLKALKGHRVVLVNVHVDRTWARANNRTIESIRGKYQYVVIVDWNKAAAAHPSWFGPDGMHVNGTGAKAYAKLVIRALG